MLKLTKRLLIGGALVFAVVAILGTTYGDKPYTVERVRTKLAHDWDDYKRTEEAIASQKELLKAREVSLTAVQERLKELRSKKEELEVQVTQLEADLKNVRPAQSRS